MKRLKITLLLFLFSLLLPFLLLETILRIKYKDFNWKNYLKEHRNLISMGFPVTNDPLLGWVTKSNYQLQEDNYKKKVTLLSEGIRSNGMQNLATLSTGNKILVVGASHAFGTEVSDTETWEAHLERIKKTITYNAAVFGYGIDQMVLRFEKLSPTLKPTIGILAIHPENISQCEMSQRFAKKPYFNIENNQLVLKNVPVSETKTQLTALQNIFGYSLFIHTFGMRFFSKYWLDSVGQVQAHKNGTEVACKLIVRFFDYCNTHKIKPLLLIQHWHHNNQEPSFLKRMDEVLSCVNKERASDILDLAIELNKTQKENPAYYDSLFTFHMTSKGNEFVANQIAQHLKLK